MPETIDAPFLTVIIPTWNRSARLDACVRSLFQQTYPRERWEVVVSDDGSTDDTAAIVAGLERDAPVQVRHVAGNHRGANAARNSGIAAARGDVFVFLDDDELAPPSHLGVIARHLAARLDVAGVGGPYEDAGDSRVRTCASCALGASRLAPDELSVVGELLGGNMAIRRSAIESAGLFDEALKGRGEETEWFGRSPASFLYDPALVIRHRRDDTGLLELCRRQFREGRGLARAQRARGKCYRPSPVRIVRFAGHFVRRRCARGAVLAARELGATLGWLLLHLGRRER